MCDNVFTDVSGVFALATQSAAEVNALLTEMTSASDRLSTDIVTGSAAGLLSFSVRRDV